MRILKIILALAIAGLVSGLVCLLYGASEIPIYVPASNYDANHPASEKDLRDYVQQSNGYKLVIIGAKVFGTGLALFIIVCLINAKIDYNNNNRVEPVTAPILPQKKSVKIDSNPKIIIEQDTGTAAAVAAVTATAHSATAIANYIDESRDHRHRYIFRTPRKIPPIVEII